jgi:hypothetical protein
MPMFVFSSAHYLVALIALAVVGAPIAAAIELGDSVPNTFRLRFLAAQRASLDGEHRDALRQVTKVLDGLKIDPAVKRNLEVNHSYVKSMCLALKAQLLADIGATSEASRFLGDARRTLKNQEALLRKKRLNAALLSDELAVLELIEASVERPAMDFSLGVLDVTKEADADPFRWKLALDRCGKQLAFAGIVQGRLAGRHVVELARATMHKPIRANADLEEDRYRDARLFLGAAKTAFQEDPVWAKVVDPKNPITFNMVDDLKQLGADIKLDDEVAIKTVIAMVLRDWMEWRLAQAELQARQENTDPELGWDFDNAATQFDEMCNFLRVQYGGDDHPAVYRVRLSRARWFIFNALRLIDELDADFAQDAEADGAEKAHDRAKKIAKARSLVKDAILTLKDMGATKRVSPLMEEECAIAELSALTLQQRVSRLEKKLPGDEQANFQRRMDDLSSRLKAGEFRQRAREMVEPFVSKSKED